MKVYKLILNGCKPFSINGAYYRKTFNKTTECRRWESQILGKLTSPGNKEIIRQLRESADTSKFGYGVYFKYEIPSTNFWNQKGTISRKSMDLSNIEKLLLDLIFGDDIVGIGVDDTNVIQLVSEKSPAKDYKIIVQIKLIILKRLK